MPIIKEDGSIVANANSYVTEEEFVGYAGSRGISLDGLSVEQLLIKSTDFINSFEARLKGSKVSRDQPLAFPRKDFEAEGWSWSSSEIPRQVINAQLSVAIEIAQGEDPYNPKPSLPVVKKKVDVVEVEYANPGDALKVNKKQPSQVHINLLLNKSGLTVVRS